MNVSHVHRCLFFHVPKTGGTSVQSLGVLDYRGHLPTAAQLQGRLPPEQWRAYFKFAFVRNPWDRLVSAYSYLRQLPPGHRWYVDNNVLVAQRLRRFASFGEFCRELPRSDLAAHLHFLPQTYWLADRQGRLLTDFLGRFENLQRDFAAVMKQLGLDGVTLPQTNASRHDAYQSYYDPESAEIVGRLYRQDVETLGYTFDGQGASHVLHDR